MEFTELLKNRRSIRKYTGEEISEETLHKILEAGLLSFSGRNKKPWEFIVVRDKEMLKKLSHFRPGGAGMLAQASAAIIVLADTELTDVWTEDCSIAMTLMHLMASSLGVGSCWIQGRLREAPDGRASEELIREMFSVPKQYSLEAILSLGMPAENPGPREIEETTYGKIHREKF